MLGTGDFGRRRVSDYLNDPNVDLVVLDEAWIGDLVRPEAPPGRLAPAHFRKQDVLVAAALDQPDPAGARSAQVRTTTVNVVASIGPYLVVGLIHLPATVRFDIRRLFGSDSRAFVPLTNARLTHLVSATSAALYPVLLVRASRVEFAGLPAVADPGLPAPHLAALYERIQALTARPRPSIVGDVRATMNGDPRQSLVGEPRQSLGGDPRPSLVGDPRGLRPGDPRGSPS